MSNKTSRQVVQANTFEGFLVGRVKNFEDSLVCMSIFKICREENWREDQINTAYGK